MKLSSIISIVATLSLVDLRPHFYCRPIANRMKRSAVFDAGQKLEWDVITILM
jgi:dihydroorotase